MISLLKNAKTLCYGFLFLSAMWLSPIRAQEPATSNDETTFFAAVNETGGYINQALHQDFWTLMQKKYTQEQRDKIIHDIQSTLEILKEFQALTWKSAKESYFAKSVIKDSEYQPLKEKLEKHQSQYFSPQVIIDNSEKIIAASSTRSALDLGAGKFYITPELIDENLIGIKGSYDRLKLLLLPVWKEEYKEYTLPLINVSLLSLYSPDEYHEVIQHGDEQIDIHIAQLSVDKNVLYELGSVDYQKGDKKFIDFTPEERQIYIQEFVKDQFANYNITEPMLSKGNWRGYEYAKGMASLDNYNIVIMSLFVDSKAFYIKYVTNTNLSVAGAEFNDFTKRIQVLETNKNPPVVQEPVKS